MLKPSATIFGKVLTENQLLDLWLCELFAGSAVIQVGALHQHWVVAFNYFHFWVLIFQQTLLFLSSHVFQRPTNKERPHKILCQCKLLLNLHKSHCCVTILGMTQLSPNLYINAAQGLVAKLQWIIRWIVDFSSAKHGGHPLTRICFLLLKLSIMRIFCILAI